MILIGYPAVGVYLVTSRVVAHAPAVVGWAAGQGRRLVALADDAAPDITTVAGHFGIPVIAGVEGGDYDLAIRVAQAEFGYPVRVLRAPEDYAPRCGLEDRVTTILWWETGGLVQLLEALDLTTSDLDGLEEANDEAARLLRQA